MGTAMHCVCFHSFALTTELRLDHCNWLAICSRREAFCSGICLGYLAAMPACGKLIYVIHFTVLFTPKLQSFYFPLSMH